ncbi:MAG: cysteine hydrolase [Ilumatobacteraceae bacterium]|nr:MAG: cysteine hydrolase [Actinomycetota bacterium]
MELVPAETAVLTMELQRGVCGDIAPFPALREVVEALHVEANVARLLHCTRRTGARVVHCTFSIRSDQAGTRLDFPLMSVARRVPGYMQQGSPSTQLLPSLGPEPGDLFVDRHHGVSAFSGTGLDALLRSFGTRTLVVTGVSLNIGVIGTVIEAVNLGYSVVVPRDAVAGVPAEYGEAVLANAIWPIAAITTTDDVLRPWAS